jgi:prolyl-tRNA synthetase
MNVYNRLWIGKDTIITVASGWAMSDKPSHEFQTFLEIWEDTIYVCDKCKVAYNAEIVWENFKCLNCWNKDLEVRKACEVWNIFYLGTKYSKPFWLSFSGENNKMVDKVEMWCYGIWISRLMWVIAEYFMTENWIAWPEEVAPYDYYIIVIWEENLEKAEKLGLEIELIKWKSVILDDRVNIGFWQRAWDCELFWILNRIVISSKTLEKWGYELKGRNKEELIVKF